LGVINGIQYKTAYPLTLENHEGSYYIIKMGSEKYKADNFKLE